MATTRIKLTQTTEGIQLKTTYLELTWLRYCGPRRKRVATTKVVVDVTLDPEADLTELLSA